MLLELVNIECLKEIVLREHSLKRWLTNNIRLFKLSQGRGFYGKCS